MTSLQSVDKQKLGIEEGTGVDTWMPVLWGNRIEFIGGPGWTRMRRSSGMGEEDGVEGGSAGRDDCNRGAFDGWYENLVE